MRPVTVSETSKRYSTIDCHHRLLLHSLRRRHKNGYRIRRGSHHRNQFTEPSVPIQESAPPMSWLPCWL